MVNTGDDPSATTLRPVAGELDDDRCIAGDFTTNDLPGTRVGSGVLSSSESSSAITDSYTTLPRLYFCDIVMGGATAEDEA